MDFKKNADVDFAAVVPVVLGHRSGLARDDQPPATQL